MRRTLDISSNLWHPVKLCESAQVGHSPDGLANGVNLDIAKTAPPLPLCTFLLPRDWLSVLMVEAMEARGLRKCSLRTLQFSQLQKSVMVGGVGCSSYNTELHCCYKRYKILADTCARIPLDNNSWL